MIGRLLLGGQEKGQKKAWWFGMLPRRVVSETMELSLEEGNIRRDKQLPDSAAWQVKSRHEEEGM